MESPKASLIFLGTGTSQGIPVIGSQHPVCLSHDSKDKRLRSSVYIQSQNSHILIDCGPDFRQQMLRENLSKLDAIIFTHEHNDHVLGLDDVRPIFFRQQKNIDLYALPEVLQAVQERFPYAFSEQKYPGIPEFNLHTLEAYKSFEITDCSLLPIAVWHGKLKILGFRIHNLAYLTDVSAIPERSMALLQNLDVLIINVLRKEPRHQAHLVLDQALEILEKLQPKKTYFTHISHLLGFHEEVQNELPDEVFLAYDGLKIEW